MSIDPEEKAIRQEIREFKFSPVFSKDAPITEFPTFDEVVEWESGIPKLKKAHLKHLQRELDEMDNAIQYALTAETDRYYSCQRCFKKQIYLRKGEIWRYGVTRKGEKGRYSEEYLRENKLEFLVQERGDLQKCLKEEKKKIFYYPLLPENLVRQDNERLIKPPGNLRTD